jgi:hypothetical protein
MKKYIIFFVLSISLVAQFAYAAQEESNEQDSSLVTITGTVEHYAYSGGSGGIYIIKGDDGKEYKPIEMSEGFQIEALRVKVYGRLITKKLLFDSPRIPIEIITIERVPRKRGADSSKI